MDSKMIVERASYGSRQDFRVIKVEWGCSLPKFLANSATSNLEAFQFMLAF